MAGFGLRFGLGLGDHGEEVVGVDVVGEQVGCCGEVPLERLWHSVPCFPTRSEVWLRLLEEYGL